MSSVILITGLERPNGRITYPITESETIMRRSTTQVDNETDEDEADNGEYLDGSEPKLAFTKGTGSQKVDYEDDDTRDCNPHSVVDLGVPVCDCSLVISIDCVWRNDGVKTHN